tara:strand:- start:3876 stop:4481 length:606 start_codon:yes stop_codon:yes gene_type:complete
MDKVFKLKNGTSIDVIEHTNSVTAENKALGYVTIIYIGTDSQDRGGKSTYATCICYRSGFYNPPEYKGAEPEFVGKGVHYIYTKEKIPRIRDIWSRLYKETEFTMEIATWFIEQYPNADVTVDLDYNIKPSEDSHILVSATKGWAESMGMKVNIKLDWEDETTKYHVQVATKAADRECRGGGSKAGNRKKFRRESKRAIKS